MEGQEIIIKMDVKELREIIKPIQEITYSVHRIAALVDKKEIPPKIHQNWVTVAYSSEVRELMDSIWQLRDKIEELFTSIESLINK